MDSLWERGEYLLFKDVGKARKGGTTHVFDVMSKTGAALGIIKWFPHWRKYTFHPGPETVFDPKCLTELSEYCTLKTVEHNAGKGYPRDYRGFCKPKVDNPDQV